MGMKKRGKGKKTHEAKRKKRSRRKLGKELKIGYVTHIVKVHYGQPCRLAL